MAGVGTGAVCVWILFGGRADYCADRVRIRGREAARDAVCDVDAAGDLHPGRDWSHFVLRAAGSDAAAVPRLQGCGEARIHVLPTLRIGGAADVPQLREGRGVRVDELPALRDEAAVADAAGGVNGKV